MEENKTDTMKLVIGFIIAFGALLTAAVGFLIGSYATGKDLTLAIIGWSLGALGLLEALFVKKIVALLFSIRQKNMGGPES